MGKQTKDGKSSYIRVLMWSWVGMVMEKTALIEMVRLNKYLEKAEKLVM